MRLFFKRLWQLIKAFLSIVLIIIDRFILALAFWKNQYSLKEINEFPHYKNEVQRRVVYYLLTTIIVTITLLVIHFFF